MLCALLTATPRLGVQLHPFPVPQQAGNGTDPPTSHRNSGVAEPLPSPMEPQQAGLWLVDL